MAFEAMDRGLADCRHRAWVNQAKGCEIGDPFLEGRLQLVLGLACGSFAGQFGAEGGAAR
jgi:hypothetical protein